MYHICIDTIYTDTIRKEQVMSRQGITFEQVAAVADALAGEGQQPTIRAVRERLGDTGSPNTIHKYLVTWREARPVPPADAPELPHTLTAAIANEIERAAARARAEIEGRLVQAQAEAVELAAAGEMLEAERDELIEQVAELTRQRDTLAGKAAQQAADLSEAQQRIDREQHAAESARVELATARLKVEAQAERVNELTAELERLRAALAEAQQGRIAAEQQAAVLSARLDACADARSERDEALKAAAEAREQAARLAGQIDALRQQQ
jgi:colicin import membrane protein